MFSKILIANRGEIAVRIIRACREMGISTVAVYSTADRDSLHVSLADESVCIGSAHAAESYLNMTAVISAATATGAQAVHPGYGLLAENSRFARLCEECGLVFIGPSADVIEKMGDKAAARKTAEDAGVEVIPGSDVTESLRQAEKEGERIGFPLMIKAKAGGGGKGIRLVKDRNDFEKAFLAASKEALSAFGDGGIYLEKYIKPASHIEVQILRDGSGKTVCLGERECSIQLNNQKLLEETPAPAADERLREGLYAAAVKVAEKCGYENAGTVEFLVDTDGNFYFMEMNTRLQVEHTVTEMVSGTDIVKWQIRIAAGRNLDSTVTGDRKRGCAIECRINALAPGTLATFHIPGGPDVRFDTALYQGCTVPPYYDSMVGKLIVGAETRDEAIRKMNAALCELVVEGISTNRDQLLDILGDERFVSGKYSTDFMEGTGK